MLGEPTKAQIAEAYQLTQPPGASNSKKQKKTRNPKDLSAVIAAGMKKAKLVLPVLFGTWGHIMIPPMPRYDRPKPHTHHRGAHSK